MSRVVVRSQRLVRTVWMPLGLAYWCLVVWIAVGIAFQVPWWFAPVFAAVGGAAVVAALWLAIGSLRMRMVMEADRLAAFGWLWRDDIFVGRARIAGVQVVDFFDPRLHSLLWIRGNPYPAQLEVTLRSGDTIGLPSSFGPRRLLRRQAEEIADWAASDHPPSARADGDVHDGYILDTMPTWVARSRWYAAAIGIGICSVLLVIAVAALPGDGVRWLPSAVAGAAGGIAALGRLGRRVAETSGSVERDRLL
ncbi:hypothetical protein HD594_000048 [Microbacterium thalassium]|uniref:PH domain-containing protein n=1 Tax=Microbacterium thalassium TaxID=362649 RepID=A0A7X0FLH8_9MICO|nr:hypothetical protein [Microbacterium thalassium]